MNKTLLVAQREFVENMRTKTFWLGILSFPVLIVVAIFVAKLFEDSKDVRPYAVYDRSDRQWLSQRIREAIASSDFREIRQKLQSEDPDDVAEAGDKLRRLVDSLEEDHPIRALFERLAAIGDSVDPAGIEDESDVPPELRGVINAWMQEVMRDTRKLAAVQDLVKVSFGKYREVELEGLGDDPESSLRARLDAGEIFAYFVIGEDPVGTDDTSGYFSNNQTDDDLRKWYERHATHIVRAERVKELDLTDEEAGLLLSDFDFSEKTFDPDTGSVKDVTTEDKAGDLAPVAFVYLLWIAVFTAANMLLTNTIEEKSNRLIEVLLSSVSPLQLMAGKVIGIGATGLTIVASWVVSALIGVQFAPQGLGVDLGAIVGNPMYLGSFVAYFLTGYLLFAAVLVAIGSVCNSLKEAQSLMQPVFILLMVPLIAMVPVVQDPNGTMAKVLTYIPLFTPFLMMNRAAAPPPAWEYVASSIVIFVALVIAFWGAAKIFRIGILMTGKPPKVREILGWLRAPVGIVATPADTAGDARN